MEAVAILALVGGLIWAVGRVRVDIVKSYQQQHFANLLGPREEALAEASRGAALIVLTVVAYLHIGRALPGWCFFVALAAVIWGIVWLNHGAKLAGFGRDPKLIAASLSKTGIGVAIYLLVWHPPSAWLPLSRIIAAFLAQTAPYGAWAVSMIVIWCLVTGLTKLVLVMRGFPATPWDNQNLGMPHGTADFSKPDDPGFKL